MAQPAYDAPSNEFSPTQLVTDRDEVARLLEELHGIEAQIVRMYHLEGKSYQEISSAVGMPENSIGPTLSRAPRKKCAVPAWNKAAAGFSTLKTRLSWIADFLRYGLVRCGLIELRPAFLGASWERIGS